MSVAGKKKWVLLGLAVLLLAGLAAGGSYLVRVNRYQTQLRELTIGEVDISALSDGVYRGSYDADMVAATVDVTVRQGAIAAVDIVEHHQERGLPAERIAEDIVAQQRIGVDIVSSATNSSKVIEKAVELALRNAAE